MSTHQDSPLLSRNHVSCKEAFTFPERVIQIGEGNFLRGFVDWMIHQLNKKRLFCGRIVVVAPRKTGAHNIERINAQDGQFTLWLRGLQNGRRVDEWEIVSSISRGIDPYQNWSEFLACAENLSIDIVVSNTTESGIQYSAEEFKEGVPVQSFPGKLTAYLYRRYCHFNGAAFAGMTIVPCELVEDNGNQLRQIVIRHARDWGLPHAFIDWIESQNYFCNTLVDRIVTGFPQGKDAAQLLLQLSYRDELVTVGEPFHLWAIEADERLKRAWPFEQVGLNVQFVSDVSPYRMQKVRILNGAHTAMCALGLLSGVKTVGEIMQHPVLGHFVHLLMVEEIVPTLLSSASELNEPSVLAFTRSVVDRFKNPYVRHELESFILNGLSKIRVRLLPTLNDYYHQHGYVPPLLTAAFAGQLLLYRHEHQVETHIVDKDDPKKVSLMQDIWRKESTVGLEETVSKLLALSEFWGQNLNELNGFRDRIVYFINQVRQRDTLATIELLFSLNKEG